MDWKRHRSAALLAISAFGLGISVYLGGAGCQSSSPGASRTLSSVSALWGKQVSPGITVLTGYDPTLPELADPYVTQFQNSVLISGTAGYSLKFQSIAGIAQGGPFEIVWNDFYYPDGTLMEGGRASAASWDMKPSLWSRSQQAEPRLWNPASDSDPPLIVWYGGHMRPEPGASVSVWPRDNYSRDVFAFLEHDPGTWFSMPDSIFAPRKTWPRAIGNFLGHRYGHQIVNVPRVDPGKSVRWVPAVFYEEVTDIRPDGSPSVTRIFMDEMQSPLLVRGLPAELLSPINPTTGKAFPSALREDGSALIEGPLYFRFRLDGEDWEGIGFSAGSYYGRYPSCFASRRVADGLLGKPFQIDLTDDGTDFHDAGAELGRLFQMTGGPGRPAVIVSSEGNAIPDKDGLLQVLVHGYRHDIPMKPIRVVIHAPLSVEKGPRGVPRFNIPVRPLPPQQVVSETTHESLTLEAGKLLSSGSRQNL